MSGYAPERPRTILKPRPIWKRLDAVTSERIWSSPGARTLLWAFVSMLLLGALRVTWMTGFAPGPLLFAAAMLLPPLFFVGIVPPPGRPFFDNYVKGLFATGALIPLLYALLWLAQFSRLRRYYETALGWG